MRIKIDIPTQKLFEHSIEIRTTDVNFGNHLGNERILMFAQECRGNWFKNYGVDETNLWGTHTLVADAAIQYLKEGFAYDMLDIRLYLGSMHRYGFDLYYDVVRQSGSNAIQGEEEHIALAKTAILFRDNLSKNLVAPPPELLAIIK